MAFCQNKIKGRHDLEKLSNESLVHLMFGCSRHLTVQLPLWLSSIGGLTGLLMREPLWLSHQLNVSLSNALRLGIAQLLIRRSELEILFGQPILARSNQLKRYLCHLARGELREVLWILFLDQNHRLICQERVAEGQVNRIECCPRKIFKLALMHEASAIILVHNHPAGDAQPSTADGIVTEKLFEIGSSLGIQLLDHYVVTYNQVTSLLAKGWLRATDFPE